MKGLFIPDITAEMFRNGCLESIEALMVEGKIYDIDYEPEPKKGKWIKLYPRAYKCSECKTWWEESEDDEIKEFTYCPKCGKKMEVENEHR